MFSRIFIYLFFFYFEFNFKSPNCEDYSTNTMMLVYSDSNFTLLADLVV